VTGSDVTLIRVAALSEDTMAIEWSYADLESDQLALVAEAEQALDTDIVLAFQPSRWGTVDPEGVVADGLRPVDLEATQLEHLREIEDRVGGVLVAYRRVTTMAGPG
jgi:hypothetical protein